MLFFAKKLLAALLLPPSGPLLLALFLTVAPTAFTTAAPSALEGWLPGDLRKARTALNEHLGIALYSLFPPKG